MIEFLCTNVSGYSNRFKYYFDAGNNIAVNFKLLCDLPFKPAFHYSFDLHKIIKPDFGCTSDSLYTMECEFVYIRHNHVKYYFRNHPATFSFTLPNNGFCYSNAPYKEGVKYHFDFQQILKPDKYG